MAPPHTWMKTLWYDGDNDPRTFLDCVHYILHNRTGTYISKTRPPDETYWGSMTAIQHERAYYTGEEKQFTGKDYEEYDCGSDGENPEPDSNTADPESSSKASKPKPTSEDTVTFVHVEPSDNTQDAWYLGLANGQLLPGEPKGMGIELNRTRWDIYRFPDSYITVIKKDSNARGQKKLEGMYIAPVFSNYRAVTIWRDILRGSRILAPVDEINPTHDTHRWATLNVGYVDNPHAENDKESSRHYKIKATGFFDYTVNAAFRKRSRKGRWRLLRTVAELPDVAEEYKRKWKLYRTEDGRHLYAQPDDVKQIYKIEVSPFIREWNVGKLSDDAIDLNRTRWTAKGQWVYQRSFDPGNGKMFIHLHVCVDQNDVIQDRIIVKWIYMEGPNTQGLKRDDIATAKKRKEEFKARPHPQEIVNHLEVDNDGQTQHILHFLGCSDRREDLNSDNYHYRLYMEYAPFGTLYDLMSADDFRAFPEVFLWILARNLVSACTEMQELDYIHPDLKPENIFMKDRSVDPDYPGYYTPVVGDFGVMYRTTHMINQPDGTQGWHVPEQIPLYPPGGRPVTGTFHTYIIGLIVWSVMRHKINGLWNHAFDRGNDQIDAEGKIIYFAEEAEEDDNPRFRRQHKFPETPADFVPEEDTHMYSYRLVKFVQDCMKVKPGERLSLDEMETRINAALRDLDEQIPELSEMTFDQLPEFMRIERKDEFDIGTKRPAAEKTDAEFESDPESDEDDDDDDDY